MRRRGRPPGAGVLAGCGVAAALCWVAMCVVARAGAFVGGEGEAFFAEGAEAPVVGI